MKANDNEILQNKVTGSNLSAAEYMELIDAINYIMTFVGNNGGSFLTIGADAESDVGNEQGIYIYSPEYTPPDYGWAGGPGQMAIGDGSRVFGWKCTAIGSGCWAGNLSAVALGVHSFAGATHALAVGRGACAILPNSTVLGSRSNTELWIGCVQGNAWDQKDTDGNIMPYAVDPQADMTIYESTVRGPDAKDWRETPDGTYDNSDGGHTAIAGGVSTGTGKGGNVSFKTCPDVPANTDGNAQNPLVVAGRFDSERGVDTRFLLLDLTGGGVKRVSFGADDSAGTGYKVLRVEN